MNIIDSHAHIYPQKIADKATKSIGDFYDIKTNCTGSVDGLLQSGREIGVKKYVVHSVAVSPEKVQAINDFILENVREHSEFIGFMTLHQNMTKNQIDEEISRCIENNFAGIKMHPDIQQFAIDSDCAKVIYEVNNRRLPFLLHTGDKRYHYSNPKRLARVAKQFPNTYFIGAHFGGYSEWDSVECYIDTPNVFFDTSSALIFMDNNKAKKIIETLGHKRFFFGTDFPVTNHKDELNRFLSLELDEKINQDILYNNFLDFLNKAKISI